MSTGENFERFRNNGSAPEYDGHEVRKNDVRPFLFEELKQRLDALDDDVFEFEDGSDKPSASEVDQYEKGKIVELVEELLGERAFS